MGRMVEAPTTDGLILVNVLLKSMGYCSRKKLDKDLGIWQWERFCLLTVYSPSGALTRCL